MLLLVQNFASRSAPRTALHSSAMHRTAPHWHRAPHRTVFSTHQKIKASRPGPGKLKFCCDDGTGKVNQVKSIWFVAVMMVDTRN
jgi:hypothetical protein